jgi:hypothetical protein
MSDPGDRRAGGGARSERLGAVFPNDQIRLAVEQTSGNPVRLKDTDHRARILEGEERRSDTQDEAVTVPDDGQEHVPGHDRLDRVMGDDGHTGNGAEKVVLDRRQITTGPLRHSTLSSKQRRDCTNRRVVGATGAPRGAGIRCGRRASMSRPDDRFAALFTLSPELFDELRAFAHAARDQGEEANLALDPDLPAQVADLYRAVENPDLGGAESEEATAVRILVTRRAAQLLADGGTYELMSTLLAARSDEEGPQAGRLLVELDKFVSWCAERFRE